MDIDALIRRLNEAAQHVLDTSALSADEKAETGLMITGYHAALEAMKSQRALDEAMPGICATIANFCDLVHSNFVSEDA